MGGLFSKPKIPSIPPVTEVKEPPVIEEADTEATQEDLKRRRSKLSRPRSILAGDLTPDTGKKRRLGS